MTGMNFPIVPPRPAEMVERVANAIDALDHRKAKSMDELTRMIARAAIKAMRDPTPKMIDAAYDKRDIIPEDSWPAMIDAALTTPAVTE